MGDLDVFQLFYVSTAKRALSHAELTDLLVAARVKNARLGITGALAYADGSFFQALEGREEAVRSLMDDIHGDRRHGDVRVVLETRVRERSFARWAMDFRGLHRNDPVHAEFVDLVRPDAGDTGGALQRLLRRIYELNS